MDNENLITGRADLKGRMPKKNRALRQSYSGSDFQDSRVTMVAASPRILIGIWFRTVI